MPTILKKALGLVLADNTRLSRSSQLAKPVHTVPNLPNAAGAAWR